MKIPEKSDLPSWSVTIEVPLVKETITIDELLEDSLFVGIPYGTDGDSIFAYQDQIEIEKVEIGDQLNIDDIQQSFTQSVEDVNVEEKSKQYSSQMDPVGVDPVNQSVASLLGKITLNDTDPTETDPVLLTELIDLSGVNEGDETVVLQYTEAPTIYRTVNFDEFNNADFSDGLLAITISNDLVLELGAPITVRLLESDSTIIYGSDGDDSAKVTWTTGINPGESAEKTISLAGKLLPGNIIVQITGVVAGSGDANITNNSTSRNSSFVVEVQAKNLEVTSAEAIIPEQEIDTTDAITLADSDNKVQRAKILNGSLAVDIVNNLPVNANLELTITSIDISDADGIQAFTQIIPLTAKQSSNPIYLLNDEFLIMDVNDQKVDYSYHIITQDTDQDKVEISENDGVTVNISIYGSAPGEQITFSEFEGIVAQDPIIESGEIDITTDSKITTATISSGTMNITIRNNINLSESNVPQLSIVIPEFIDQSSNPIDITRDLLPEPNTTIIQIDLAGYVLHPNTIDVSADSFNQNITYNSDVVIPSGVISSYDLQGNISVEILVSELAFSSVTGYFNQDAIVDNNTIVLEEETKIEEALFNTGELILTIVNNIGAVAVVNFSVDEIITKTTNAPLQHTINLSNSSDPVIESIPLDDYKIMIPLTEITTNQEIHYTSTVSIPSDQEMTLSFGNEIDVNVDLVNLSFESVSGYIDTVTVSIDSVDQEITALPEELNGINLNDVEIQIEFDSNIGVPVVLDLTLVSSNESGETVESTVHQNIIDNPIVQIPNASALINIKPNRIIASGSASVGGSGYVSVDQYIQGTMNISIPMSFEITDDATIDIEPSLVKEEIPEELEEITLYALLDNQFEFNGILQVLAAKDTLYFDDDPLIKPDTIAIFHLLPDSVYEETILIDDGKFNLFQDSLYTKTRVKLLSNLDSDGNPKPTRLFKNDSLTIQLSASIKGLIDLSDDNE
ncbi:MAG: hypothetical protein L6422_12265 [Candidatus Marinimicrobia bacterium]|nr:hypothetical protein [Candidatus Neomarinimicrobiota bacterium]